MSSSVHGIMARLSAGLLRTRTLAWHGSVVSLQASTVGGSRHTGRGAALWCCEVQSVQSVQSVGTIGTIQYTRYCAYDTSIMYRTLHSSS